MNDICREITIGSKNIGANLQNDFALFKTYDFMAFGYDDIIKVSENFHQQGEHIMTTLQNRMESRFSDVNTIGNYSLQRVNCVRTENEYEIIRDEDFWEELDKIRLSKNFNIHRTFPFFMVIFIHLENRPVDYSSFRKHVENIIYEKGKNGKQEQIAEGICYVTTDESDLILVVKSKTLEDAFDISESLHTKRCVLYKYNQEGNDYYQKVFMKYTYAVSSFVSLEQLEEYHKEYLKKIPSDMVYIEIKEATPGIVESIIKNNKELVSDKVQAYNAQGSNDHVIYIKGLDWASIFIINNILLDENKRGTILSLHTSFFTKIKETSLKKYIFSNDSECQNDDYFNCDKCRSLSSHIDINMLTDKLLNIVREIPYEDLTSSQKSIVNSFYPLIGALKNFEADIISNYSFFSISSALSIIIEYFYEHYNDKEVSLKIKTETEDNIFKFFSSIGSSIQSYSKAGREKVFENLDFDVALYDAPAVLITFYNAYIKMCSSILNTTPKNYQFMVCTGESRDVKCLELLNEKAIGKEKSLVQTSIPGHQLFNIKQTPIFLIHELAHIVGRETKQRDKRYKYIVGCVFHIFKLELLLDFDIQESKFSEEEIDNVINYLKKEFDEQFKKCGVKGTYHSNTIKPYITCCFEKIFVKEFNELNCFNQMIIDNDNITSAYEYFQSKEKVIYGYKRVITLLLDRNNTNQPQSDLYDKHSKKTLPAITNFKDIVDILFEQFSELYADMITLNCLNIDLETYYNCFFDDKNIQNEYPAIKYRCALFSFIFFGFGEKISKDILTKIAKEQSAFPGIQSLFKDIYAGHRMFSGENVSAEKWIKEKWTNNEKSKFGHVKCLDLFVYKEITQAIKEYLDECQKSFNDKISKSGINKIQNLYKELQEIENVEAFINRIEKIIEEEYSKSTYQFSFNEKISPSLDAMLRKGIISILDGADWYVNREAPEFVNIKKLLKEYINPNSRILHLGVGDGTCYRIFENSSNEQYSISNHLYFDPCDVIELFLNKNAHYFNLTDEEIHFLSSVLRNEFLIDIYLNNPNNNNVMKAKDKIKNQSICYRLGNYDHSILLVETLLSILNNNITYILPKSVKVRKVGLLGKNIKESENFNEKQIGIFNKLRTRTNVQKNRIKRYC
jgi:hypothetical protein